MAMATTATDRRTSVPADEYMPSGWVLFAGIMLCVSGFFSSMWGLAAILNDEVVHVGGRGVLIADFTTWGWVQLLLGAFMTTTGFALIAGRSWARWTAIVIATLSAIAQVGVISAFPLWSLLVVTLDVIVIYQLTARWVSVRD
jgi:hypothetical protein